MLQVKNQLILFTMARKRLLIQYSKNQNLLKGVLNVSKFQDEKYIIYPANFYKHKNHEILIRTYRKGLDQGITLPKLIFIGVLWEGNDSPMNLIRKLGLESLIDIVGGLSPGELAKLYTNASFVIITTQFEGFCMPAVEALYFGRNLLCSDLTILHEVTDGHALFFNQNSEDDILECIVNASNTLDLASDQLTRVNSVERFNWSEAFTKTMQTLNKAYVEYYPQELVRKINDFNFEFMVLYSGEDFQWLYETILSFTNCKVSPNKISVNLINYSNSTDEALKKCLCGLPVKLSVYNHSAVVPKGLFNKIHNSDFTSIISVGSIILDSYFINILKGFFRRPNAKIIVGEVRQVHENIERTFEKNNYFRVVDEHIILKGLLYPEMFILTRNYNFYLESWNVFKDIKNIVVESIAQSQHVLVRYCFSTVRYKAPIFLSNNSDITSAINFQPDISSEQMNVSIEELEKHQRFIDYVETNIHKQIKASNIQEITEVKRILKAKQCGKSL